MSPFSEGCRGRVLVVDDDPNVLDLVTTRLKLAGYTTFTARSGVEAIRRLSEVRVNAMVLDLSMPQLDGFSVLQHMRRGGLIDRVPTMVLTARNETDDVRRAVGLGARDFLTKPFEDKQLLARVGRLCARRAIATTAPVPIRA